MQNNFINFLFSFQLRFIRRPLPCLCLTLFLTFSLVSTTLALSPEQVLVVANKNAAKSAGLAQYYMEQRKIPKENLVLVFMTDKESCSREDYLKKVVPPVRRFLDKNDHIQAIVTMYGIPLKIASPGASPEEQTKLTQMNQTVKAIEDELASGKIIDMKMKKEKTDQLAKQKRSISGYKKQLDKSAAFDSELALIKKKDSYALNMWQPNPYYLRFRNQKTTLTFSDILMVSRLDGANGDIVKRIINDSIEAEKTGLKGSAYFDARWKNPEKTIKQPGYGYYDQSIHHAAQILTKKNKTQVIVDDTEVLFKKGSNLKTALYCGWYRLANYVDAFNWQKGSVGYHIASSECATLKGNSNVWCKKMLDNGVAATIGPVGEPYVQAFPDPQIFFHYLTEKYMSLAEAYLISLPYLSWKMVLVGDPLYKVNFKP